MKNIVFTILFLSFFPAHSSNDTTQHKPGKRVSSDSALIITPRHKSILNRDSVEYTIKPLCKISSATLLVHYYHRQTDTLAVLEEPPYSALWNSRNILDQDQLHLQFGYVLFHTNGDTIVSPPQPHRWIIDRVPHRSRKRYVCKQARKRERFSVDGKLDEWNRFAAAPLSAGSSFKCSWTGADFLFAASIQDSHISSSDRVEICFDLTRSGSRFLNINHRIISFSPGGRSFSWAVDMSDTGYAYSDSIIIRIDEEMAWRSAPVENGYVIEARIPFQLLTAQQFPDKLFSFDVSIIDVNNESSSQPAVYTWSGAEPAGRHNPGEWGTIIIRQLYRPLQITLGLSLLFVFALVLAMTSLLFYRKYKDRSSEKQLSKQPSPQLKHIIKTIESNLDKPGLNQESVSQHAECSVTELNKTIRQELNTSFINLLALLRIKKTKELLAASDTNVENIAHEVGFTNASMFINAFKQLAGVTPEEWRKNRLEDEMLEEEETED